MTVEVSKLNVYAVLTLAHAYSLAAAQGSYALTGVAHHYSLSAVQGAYALTGGAVAVGYAPAPVGKPPPPPYLREGTYRVRQLGFAFDPAFVLQKDRPGPIRIVEFDGWMS